MEDLIELYTFWRDHPERHFDSTPENDAFLLLKYMDLHSKYFGKFQKLEVSDVVKEVIIGWIILGDQITRHLYRGNQEIIQKCLEHILPVAKQFYLEKKDKLTLFDFSFTLLPFRHTRKYENFFWVVQETWKRIDSGLEGYQRFLTASYQQYDKQIDDKEVLEEFDNNKGESEQKNGNKEEILDLPDYLIEILDITSQANLVSKIKDGEGLFFDTSYLDPSKKYLISLSGGVDSMVTSYVMKNAGFHIAAVHISYENRGDLCKKEIELLQKWCQYLGIKLYIRRIREIQRVPCMNHGMRDLYESYTKNMRFKAYRNASIRESEDLKPKVLLGHNKDDAMENILTNIASQSHYDNLLGMRKITEIDEIEFIRPMISIPKANIYQFAIDHGIPYLPNSTPSWSQRGQIREVVKPCLLKWNPNMEEALFHLSEIVSSMSGMCDQYLADMFKKIGNDGRKWEMRVEEMKIDGFFWNSLFRKMGIIISQKSLHNWLDKLRFIHGNFDKLELRKLNKHNLNKTTQLQWRKMDEMYIVIYF